MRLSPPEIQGHPCLCVPCLLPLSLGGLYWFSVDAVTNCHKRCGLKQHKSSHNWSPDIQNQFHWADVKVLAGVDPSGGPEEEHVSPSVVTSPVQLYLLLCPCFKDSRDDLRPTQIIQDNLPISRSLT